jgi:phosphate transport system permease protein
MARPSLDHAFDHAPARRDRRRADVFTFSRRANDLIAFSFCSPARSIGYVMNRRPRGRSAMAARLHSLAAFMASMPAAGAGARPVLILLWLALQGPVVRPHGDGQACPKEPLDGLDTGAVQLILAEIKSIAGGRIFGTPEPGRSPPPNGCRAAPASGICWWSSWHWLSWIFLAIFARARVTADFRARQGSSGSCPA